MLHLECKLCGFFSTQFRVFMVSACSYIYIYTYYPPNRFLNPNFFNGSICLCMRSGSNIMLIINFHWKSKMASNDPLVQYFVMGTSTFVYYTLRVTKMLVIKYIIVVHGDPLFLKKYRQMFHRFIQTHDLYYRLRTQLCFI